MNGTVKDRVTERAGRRQWAGLAVLVLPCVLVSMDMSIMFTTLPTLTADLRPSSSELLWIMDGYGFMLAGLLITMGTLGDRFGRRRVLLGGAVAFGLASALAAFSTTPQTLIVARMLLGVAGATLAPSTLSLIRAMFNDEKQRTTAIGVWTAGFAGGAVLGPIISGLLLEHFWWGSVFLVNTPVMALLLVLGPLLLPEFRVPAPGRFDLAGAVLSLLAVLGVIYGIKSGAEHGFGTPALLSLAAGLAFGYVFLRHQRRSPHPMLDLGLFRERRFSVALGIDALATFGMVGFSLFSWQFLQLVLGMYPFTAALWTLPTFLVMPVGIALATMAAPRLGKDRVITAGLTIAVAGFIQLALTGAHSGSLHIVTGMGIVSIGIAAVSAVVTEVIVSAAPPERAGAASAMAETSAEFGGALGIAILGSIGAAFYRADITATAPGSLDPQQLETAAATLGGAVNLAADLPHSIAAAIRDSAFAAFAHETRIAAIVCAALSAAGALLVATVLRRPRTHP